MNNIELLNSTDSSLLKDLSEKYPYAQVFPILYLKSLSLQNNIHFEEELKKYAFRITDRAKLFDLIHLSNDVSIPAEDANPAENFVSEVLEDETIVEITKETKENEIIEILPEIVTPEVEILAKNEEIIEFESEGEGSQENLEVNIPENEVEEFPNEDSTALEKEILSHIIASSYSLELEEKVNDAKIEVENISSQRNEAKEKIDLNENRSFSSWLHINSLSKQNEKTEKEPEIEKEIVKEQLINNFIQNEVKIGKPKAEFFSAPKKAKESVDEDKLIYSETLANIFALQGNFPKAIKAFEQLCLTIPEKKLYFAKKIEELNKKINS
jgi:hypothetical protein